MRTILIVHRYLGVAIGLIMTLWCLSGFVMMYRGYPAVSPEQRLAGLQPLDLSGAVAPNLGQSPIQAFRIEMFAGRPVIRLTGEGGRRIYDLRSGAEIERASPAEAAAMAEAYAVGQGVNGRAGPPRLIPVDQWTVEGASRRGPVYRIAFSDLKQTVVYVASRSGEVVQATDRASRFWAWMGAIPHWLYPRVLRQHGELWSNVVIWTSVVGVFLTVTGLYVGISRFRRTKDGRWSPYRGWYWWHHMAGLIFGLFTLTWVTSGLLTMNPWGLLESSAGETVQSVLAGSIRPADLQGFLSAAPRVIQPGASALRAAPLAGRLFVLEQFKGGRTVRLDGEGRAAPLGREALSRALAETGQPQAQMQLMSRPDGYYYPNYDGPAPLPVWVARMAGPGGRVAYLDPLSGEVRLALDGEARASRWIRVGLHDLDFPGLRERPVWDIVVWLLLAGVTAGAATGAWLGLRRIVLDLRRLKLRRS